MSSENRSSINVHDTRNTDENNLQLAIIDTKKDNNSITNSLTMYAAGSIVGASVSAIVYSSIATSGEITGSLVQTGLHLGGNLIGYGTDIIIGPIAGSSVRAFATISGAIAGPTISSSSRTVATGVSLIAGALSAIATSAIIYGAKEAGSYISSKVGNYKHHIAEKIQHSEEVHKEVEELIIETAENIYDDNNNELEGECDTLRI